jgi:hypothetical protein
MANTNLHDFCTICMIPNTLPNNLSWIHNIFQNGIMDSGKSASTRANNS